MGLEDILEKTIKKGAEKILEKLIGVKGLLAAGAILGVATVGSVYLSKNYEGKPFERPRDSQVLLEKTIPIELNDEYISISRKPDETIQAKSSVEYSPSENAVYIRNQTLPETSSNHNARIGIQPRGYISIIAPEGTEFDVEQIKRVYFNGEEFWDARTRNLEEHLAGELINQASNYLLETGKTFIPGMGKIIDLAQEHGKEKEREEYFRLIQEISGKNYALIKLNQGIPNNIAATITEDDVRVILSEKPSKENPIYIIQRIGIERLNPRDHPKGTRRGESELTITRIPQLGKIDAPSNNSQKWNEAIIVYAEENNVLVYRTSTRETRKIEETGNVINPEISPDGTRVAYGVESNGEIKTKIFDLELPFHSEKTGLTPRHWIGNRILQTTGGVYDLSTPSFSYQPDWERILQTIFFGNTEIVMIEGSSGQAMAFGVFRDGDKKDLYQITLEGTEKKEATKITDSDEEKKILGMYPGERVAFQANPSQRVENNDVGEILIYDPENKETYNPKKEVVNGHEISIDYVSQELLNLTIIDGKRIKEIQDGSLALIR